MPRSDREQLSAVTPPWRRPAVARWLALAASLMLLAGCASVEGPLDGSQWRLAAWSLSSLRADEFSITANFDAGRISGRSGVNSYSGSYKLGPGAAFSVGNLTSTEMAGPEPAMRAEHAYLTLLGEARSYRSTEGELILFDKGGNQSLIFAAAGH